jgi:hypothetical protein
MKHYRKQIEVYLQISSTKEFQAVNLFKQIRHEGEEVISMMLNKRVMQELS